MEDQAPKRILTAETTAQRLNISRTTLQKHVRRGVVTPDFKAGVSVFFNPDRLRELREAIQQNRAKHWRSLSTPAPL